jgi:hypothetical protein
MHKILKAVAISVFWGSKYVNSGASANILISLVALLESLLEHGSLCTPRSILWGQNDFGQCVFSALRFERKFRTKIAAPDHNSQGPYSAEGTWHMPLFNGANPATKTWCQTDVCDVNIFHSLTRFINVLCILYILTIHSYMAIIII